MGIIKIEDELKTKADELFTSLGIDTTSAVKMFIIQALQTNGIPFEIKLKKEKPKKEKKVEQIKETSEPIRRCGRG